MLQFLWPLQFFGSFSRSSFPAITSLYQEQLISFYTMWDPLIWVTQLQLSFFWTLSLRPQELSMSPWSRLSISSPILQSAFRPHLCPYFAADQYLRTGYCPLHRIRQSYLRSSPRFTTCFSGHIRLAWTWSHSFPTQDDKCYGY